MDFDLQLSNAQTGDIYCNNQTHVPRQVSILVKRVPLRRRFIKPISVQAARALNPYEHLD